jgi:hypothetical protein
LAELIQAQQAREMLIALRRLVLKNLANNVLLKESRAHQEPSDILARP